MQIYHNPRCSKSRQTSQIIQDKGLDVEIIEYLKDVPTKATLKEILKKLNLNAEDIVRKGEADYKENFKGKRLTNEEWIAGMVKDPKLIERVIKVKGAKAVVGRSPEQRIELTYINQFSSTKPANPQTNFGANLFKQDNSSEPATTTLN